MTQPGGEQHNASDSYLRDAIRQLTTDLAASVATVTSLRQELAALTQVVGDLRERVTTLRIDLAEERAKGATAEAARTSAGMTYRWVIQIIIPILTFIVGLLINIWLK